MPSRFEILKLFYLVSLNGAYDEIPVSKHPGPNHLYVDTTLRYYHNTWDTNPGSLILRSNYERLWGLDTTALMVAARHGHEFIVGYLLNWGADASLKNHEGKTALDIAMTAPGYLGAYYKIGISGRDNICALLARHTLLDIKSAYYVLQNATQKNLDYTCETILSCYPLLQQKLNKLFKSQKRKNKNLTDLKQIILHPPSNINNLLDLNDTKQVFSRRKYKLGV